MMDLFEENTYNELMKRLDNLTPGAKQEWGKMSLSQMMAHCSTALGAATGRVPIPRSFMGKVLGGFVKNSWVTGDKPFTRNSPTDKSLIIKHDCDFEKEKTRLKELITLFHKEGQTTSEANVHPFFGKLTADEWCNLTSRHLDHHFRQFGV